MAHSPTEAFGPLWEVGGRAVLPPTLWGSALLALAFRATILRRRYFSVGGGGNRVPFQLGPVVLTGSTGVHLFVLGSTPTGCAQVTTLSGSTGAGVVKMNVSLAGVAFTPIVLPPVYRVGELPV